MILIRFDNNPKEVGDYMYRKLYASKFGPAFNYLIANARFDSFFKQLFGSTQLNKKIANALEWANDNSNEKRLYLHPREMTKLLKRFEKTGICINIKGKKDIKKETKSRPGKSKSFSNETKPTIRGRPSKYKITDDFEKFSKVLSKPEARELLNDSLVKSNTNLFYYFLRFVLKAFCYAIRNDRMTAQKAFRTLNITNNVSNHDLEAAVNAFVDRLVSLDDRALEELVDETCKSVIDKQMLLDEVSLFGMFNLKLLGKHAG